MAETITRQDRPGVRARGYASARVIVDLLVSAAVLAVFFSLPGFLWARLMVPEARAPSVVAGVVVGLALVITAIVAHTLGWIGLLRGEIAIAVTIAVGLLPLVSPRVRGELRGLRGYRPHRRALLKLLLVFGVLLALVVVPSVLQLGGDRLPFTSTVWFYAAQAEAVRAAGSIATRAPEWGQRLPLQTDYLPFTAHAAMVFDVLPVSLLSRLELYRLAVVVAAALVTVTLLRTWFSPWFALLGACLLLATERLDVKFLSFKPETFGFVLVLLAAWSLGRLLAAPSRAWVTVTIVAAGLAFLVHAVVFLLLPAVALGMLAVHLARRARGTRQRISSVLLVAGVLAAALVVGSAVNALYAGGPRIVSYAAPRDGEGRIDPVPALGWRSGGDPTWDFRAAATSLGSSRLPPPAARPPVERLAVLVPAFAARIWPGLDGGQPLGALVLGAIVVGPFAGWRSLRRRERSAVVIWAIFAVALIIGSLAFVYAFDDFVPMRVGPRRLLPYVVIPFAVAATLDLVLLRRLAGSSMGRLGTKRARAIRRTAATVVGLALVAAVSIVGRLTGHPEDEDPRGRMSRTGFEAYTWLASETPRDARILVSGYTDGSVAAVAHRVGITDGRAPYLEDGTFLSRATDLLLGARLVFLDPGSPVARAYLAENKVDYLLAVTPGGTGDVIGGYGPFRVGLAELLKDDGLTFVRTFGEEELYLFEVERSER